MIALMLIGVGSSRRSAGQAIDLPRGRRVNLGRSSRLSLSKLNPASK
jgi:hypothetical protein